MERAVIGANIFITKTQAINKAPNYHLPTGGKCHEGLEGCFPSYKTFGGFQGLCELRGSLHVLMFFKPQHTQSHTLSHTHTYIYNIIQINIYIYKHVGLALFHALDDEFGLLLFLGRSARWPLWIHTWRRSCRWPRNGSGRRVRLCSAIL